MEETPERWALVRHVGGQDEAARTGYRLSATSSGTRLEQLHSFTVRGTQAKEMDQIRASYVLAAQAFLEKVKVVAEQGLPHRQGRHA